MIEQDLVIYLTDPTTGQTGNAVRQNYRQQLHSLIGRRLYLGYVPHQSPAGLQLYLGTYGHRRYQDLAGESRNVISIVQMTIFGRQSGGGEAVMLAAEALRLSLAGYCGRMIRHLIADIDVDADGWQLAQRPDDQSDDWILGYAADYHIHHDQQRVAAATQQPDKPPPPPPI